MNPKATIVSLTNLSPSAPPPRSLHPRNLFFFRPPPSAFRKRKLEQSEKLVSFIFCHLFPFFAVSMFYCLYFLYFKTKNVT